jgi:hypothetical protein
MVLMHSPKFMCCKLNLKCNSVLKSGIFKRLLQARGMVPLVEHLLSMCKVLGSIPSTAEKEVIRPKWICSHEQINAIIAEVGSL